MASLELKDFVEAVNDSSRRVRWVLFVLITASIITFIGANYLFTRTVFTLIGEGFFLALILVLTAQSLHYSWLRDKVWDEKFGKIRSEEAAKLTPT